MQVQYVAAEAAEINRSSVGLVAETASPGRQAAEFLSELIGKGRLAVASIVPDGGPRGRTFTLPKEFATLADWIDERNGEANLYFTLNEPWEGQSGRAGKLREQDVQWLRGVAVDLDPVADVERTPGGWDKERARLLDIAREWGSNIFASPTAIVDSGNGIQMIWLLQEPLPADDGNRAAVKAQGRGLGKLFGDGSDAIHNLERLLRIPFTTNLPDTRKKAKGRDQAEARLLSHFPERHSLRDLERVAPPSFASDAEALAHVDFDYQAVLAAAEGGDIGDALQRHADGIRDSRKGQSLLAKTDRSERDFGLVCACVERGVTDPTHLGQIAFSLSPDRLIEDDAKGKGPNYASRTINRARSHALKATPEGVFERLPDERPALAASAAPSPSTENQDDGWPEPHDIFGEAIDTNLADLPKGCLPRYLEKWIESEARRKGVSPAFAFVCLLTTAAAAIGQSLRIRPRQRDDWTELAALWAVLVAEPGYGKSPIISAATEPLRKLDAHHWRADKKKRDEWERLTRKSANRNARAEIVPDRPRIRRHVVDDATVEALVEILADNPRGILRAPDELSGFLGSFGAYKKQSDGDRSTALRTFDGKSITVDRVGKGTLRADTAVQSVLVGTQPQKIEAALSALTEDGLGQRMLFVLGDATRRRGVDEAPDEWVQFAYEHTIQTLATADYGANAAVRLADDAQAIFKSTLEEISSIGDFPGSPPALREHLEKWEKILIRIILALHACEEVELRGAVKPDEPVSAEKVSRYVRLGRFLVRHQIAFYDRFHGPGPNETEARWLAGHFLTKPEQKTVTHRTIYDARTSLRGSDIMKKRERVAIMAELEGCGWCRRGEGREDGLPTAWDINPKIHTRFLERTTREKAARSERRTAIQLAAAARRSVLASDNAA